MRFGGKGRGPTKRKMSDDGFYHSTVGKSANRTRIRSCYEIYDIRKWALNDTHDYTFYPCYEDIANKDTLQWWLIHY